VPWALTAGLPRFAGAMGWLLLLGLLGIALPLGELPPVAEALLVPVGLVGGDLGCADWPLVLPGVAIGLAAMIAACASPGTAQTGCRECAANALDASQRLSHSSSASAARAGGASVGGFREFGCRSVTARSVWHRSQPRR
jgi:hypothetical protein